MDERALCHGVRCHSLQRYIPCSHIELPVDGGTKRPGGHVAAVGLGTDAAMGVGE